MGCTFPPASYEVDYCDECLDELGERLNGDGTDLERKPETDQTTATALQLGRFRAGASAGVVPPPHAQHIVAAVKSSSSQAAFQLGAKCEVG